MQGVYGFLTVFEVLGLTEYFIYDTLKLETARQTAQEVQQMITFATPQEVAQWLVDQRDNLIGKRVKMSMTHHDVEGEIKDLQIVDNCGEKCIEICREECRPWQYNLERIIPTTAYVFEGKFYVEFTSTFHRPFIEIYLE